MSKIIQLENRKTHQYNVDARFLCLHIAAKLICGQLVHFNGLEYKIKDVIKDQPSRYFKKHNYYEIKV